MTSESVLQIPAVTKELFRSKPFKVERRATLYELVVTAKWSGKLNKRNELYVRSKVVLEGGHRESEYVSPSDAPPSIQIPENIQALFKWRGCSTQGPSHYPANPVFHAGIRDCWGLLKGERRQILAGGDPTKPCWHLVGIGPDGEEIPTYALNLNADGPKPTSEYKLEWRSWDKIGEGKERDLNAARYCAIWPEATDEELCAPDLKEKLEARLPALIAEFRGVIEGLGFTW